MPPHLVRTIPEDGGLLQENVLKFFGYSLMYAEIEDLRVIDLTSNEEIEITTDLSCEWKGKGDCTGCQQQSCILKVKLLKVYPGHQYEANFLDWQVRFHSIFVPKTSPHAQKKLFRFEKDEKWGYMDGQGKVVIEPKFIIANDFSPEGLAAVVDDRGWAYIDKKGNTVIRPFIFDNGPDEFREGLARFTIEKKFGFFNKTGKTIIKPRYDYALSFSEGLAAICIGCDIKSDNIGPPEKNGKWGYINKSGKIVIKTQFDYAYLFSEGLAAVGIRCQTIYKGEHCFMVCENCGYINNKGEIAISPRFEYACDKYENGKARVKHNGEWVYIDTKGRVIK